MHHRCRVIDIAVAIHKADDERHVRRRLAHDAIERRQVVDDEPPSEQQVLRRVARHRQLREGDQLDAQLPRALGVLQHLRRIAVKVADGGVDLGEANSKRAHD